MTDDARVRPLLRQERCFHHPVREAAARCLACGRYFCRECVTEHRGRFICAGCLAAAAFMRARHHGRVGRAALPAAALAGLLLAWAVFHGLGRMLLQIPEAYHSGTLWEASPDGDAPE